MRALIIGILLSLVGCAKPDADRRYPVTGQVIDVHPERGELVISHDDIPGYMPAMTMPFRVDDPAALAAVEPGDLVRGELVVSAQDGFLAAIERIGHRALAAAPTPAGAPIAYLIEGDTVPATAFVDHDGRRLELFDSGGAEVLTFIYTRCPFPTFCPLIDRQFQALHSALRETPALANRVRLLSITIDPANDTTAVLGAHAAGLGATDAAWRFAAVEEDRAGTFAARFGVIASKDDAQSALVHNLVTVVVGPDRRLRNIYRGNEWTPAEILSAIASSLESQR